MRLGGAARLAGTLAAASGDLRAVRQFHADSDIFYFDAALPRPADSVYHHLRGFRHHAAENILQQRRKEQRKIFARLLFFVIFAPLW